MDNANKPQNNKNQRIFLLALFLFLSLVFLCIAVLPGIVFGSNSKFSTIPIDIHSMNEADYSKYDNKITIPGIQLDIIKNIISDSGNSILEIENRLATLTAVLSSPIPSATPKPNQSITTNLPTIILSPTATLTLVATPTVTPTLSFTNTSILSNTPTPTNSPTPSKTTVWFYPTNTPTKTVTKTPTKTPTNSPTFTLTSSPTTINHAPTDLILSNTTVTEDHPQNSFIGHLVTVDPDPSDTFHYDLIDSGIGCPGTDNIYFSLTENNLHSNSSFDFETKPSYAICIRTTDNHDLYFKKPFTITIADVNEPPQIETIEFPAINEQTLMEIMITASDPDLPANLLTFSLSGEPSGATITSDGVFTWTPSESQGPADYTFDVCVSDGTLSDCETIIVTVNEVNNAPVLGVIGDRTVDEQNLLTFTATASDSDLPANLLTFSLSGEPSGATITSDGVFTWTPSESQGPADYTFDVCVSDGTLSDCETIIVTVNEVNNAPVLGVIGDRTIDEQNLLTFTAAASDSDLPANILTFSLSGEPSGATITSDGVFTWTPTEAQGPADHTFDVCVSDGNLSDCETITVTVNEVNNAPVLGVIGDRTVDEQTLLTFTAAASDSDLPANILTFSLSGEPSGATITSDGVFTWTPSESQGPADYTFDVCVSDGTLSDCETITVSVAEINSAPTLDPIGGQSIDELLELSFTATASDSDLPANLLTFSLSGEPSGATITSDGVFTWTPTEAQGPADYTFDVCVSDGTLSDCETITVTVNEVNNAPVLGVIGDRTTDEQNLLTFTAAASDSDLPANILTFSLSGEPSGATITSDGVFTWTPTEAQGPADYTFDVCVSDDALLDCETITVSVAEINSAPTLDPIGGQSVDELLELSFTATAYDSDLPDNLLTFSLSGEPSGATITSDGVFTWTPSESQGPADYTFDVCVSDGTLSDCETITVTVNEVNNAPVLGVIGDRTIDEQNLLTFTAAASDSDLPANILTFSLFGEPSGATITSDGVFTWTPTEAQGPADHTFDVCVNDGSLTDCESIYILVNEINLPPFDINLSTNAIEENLSAGTLIGNLTTIDPDNGDFFSYSLVNPGGSCLGSDNDLFSISGANLDLNTIFDYELKSTFTICIQSMDTAGLTTQKQFTINVIDSNDPPTDIQLSNASIMENQPLNTIIADISSTDINLLDTHTYTFVNPGGSCSGVDNANFSISSNQLRSNTIFDYDIKSSYTICIRTTDDGVPSLTYDKQFTISIMNENESPTDLFLNPTSIYENLPIATQIGSFSSIDPDFGDTFTYILNNDGGGCSGVDNSDFTISGANLLSAVSFDYETRTNYTICVKTTDLGGLSFRNQFVVSILDSNDPPTDISLSNNNLAENLPVTTLVGTLTTTDINPSDIHTYSLANTGPTCSGVDNSYFVIDNQNLRTAQVLDYETKSSYSVCIQTTDNGTPNLSYSKAFTITVMNVNEAPTNINLSNNEITENQNVNSLIGVLSSIDPDSSTFTYTLVNPGGVCSGMDNAFFLIAGVTLRSNAVFDYETRNSYTVCIRTLDAGGLTYDKQFTILVSDVNETSPVCINSTPFGTDYAPPPNGFVDAISPANNATDVAMSLSYITVYFNQPMETGTGAHGVQKTGNYELRNLSNNDWLAITSVSYNTSTYVAQVYFDKATNWSNLTSYQFTVDKEIENDPACGVKQDVNIRIQFTTSSSGVSSPITDVSNISPTISPTISIIFTEIPEIIETPAITETPSAIISPEPTETILATSQLPERTPEPSLHPTGLPKIAITRPPLPDKPWQDSTLLGTDENILPVILLTLPMSIILILINKFSFF